MPGYGMMPGQSYGMAVPGGMSYGGGMMSNQPGVMGGMPMGGMPMGGMPMYGNGLMAPMGSTQPMGMGMGGLQQNMQSM